MEWKSAVKKYYAEQWKFSNDIRVAGNPLVTVVHKNSSMR